MNTYKTPVESVIVVETVQQQEPTFADKAKELFQQVGEKMGLVQSPTVLPVSNPDHLTGPLAEINEVRAEMGISNTEQQKPLADRARETFENVGASIEPYTEKVKDSLYQAGETLGIVQPVQNIDGPLAEIQDVRQEMGKSKMDQPIQKPLTERAKETWNEAGERIEPYTEKARESLQQAGETLSFATERAKETWNEAGERIEPYVEKSKVSLQQAGETLGFIKPVQNIEGPLAEIQDVRQEMGWSKMEQPIQKPLTVIAKETWTEAGERIEPYTEKAKESLQQAGETLSFATERAKDTWYEAGERIEPYAEKAKESLQQAGESLYKAGETIGIIKPVQNIEGPLAEIQDVRKDMGWSRMEQPIQKPLTVRAQETLNQASEKIEPYAEKARATLNQAGDRIEPYTEKARLTLNQAGERIEPYVEKSKESLQYAGETLGFIKPVQNIDGPLAEIQDVRKEMGWSRMEQPIQKPLTERAKESWNEAGERILPYTEIAKESLHQAGETLGFVKPAQNIEGPLAEIQDVRKEMGKPRMEQPIQKPLSERAKETWNEAGQKLEPYADKAWEAWNEAGERIEPYADKARETWNEAGNRIEPYVEKSKESIKQAGETLGFVKPAQNIEGPLAEIQDVRQEKGWSKMEQPYQKPFSQQAKETLNVAGLKAKETWNEAGERIEPYTEKAKETLNEAGLRAKESWNEAGLRARETWDEQFSLINNPQNVTIVQQTPFVGKNLKPTNEKIELYAENAGDDLRPVVDEAGNVKNLKLTNEKIELYAENAGDDLRPVVGEAVKGKNLKPTNEKIELYAENAGDDMRPVVEEGYTGESGKKGSDFEAVAKTKIAPENEFTIGSSAKTLPA